MPSVCYLNHPPIQRLIQSLPVAEHSVAVGADFWREPCRSAGRSDLHAALFAGHPAVRISRSWLHQATEVSAELRCLAILLWGYPEGARGNLHHRWIRQLPAMAAAAVRPQAWEDYHANLAGLGGLGISTISKLAHFLGHSFDGQPALILDRRILALCAAGRWIELAPLQDLSYPNAHRRYVDYLRTLQAAAVSGGFRGDQLEFFLFALGGAF